MSVLRGTFRLSLVVALLVAAYFGIMAHVTAQDDYSKERKLWFTLRCGEPFWVMSSRSCVSEPLRSAVSSARDPLLWRDPDR